MKENGEKRRKAGRDNSEEREREGNKEELRKRARER